VLPISIMIGEKASRMILARRLDPRGSEY